MNEPNTTHVAHLVDWSWAGPPAAWSIDALQRYAPPATRHSVHLIGDDQARRDARPWFPSGIDAGIADTRSAESLEGRSGPESPCVTILWSSRRPDAAPVGPIHRFIAPDDGRAPSGFALPLPMPDEAWRNRVLSPGVTDRSAARGCLDITEDPSHIVLCSIGWPASSISANRVSHIAGVLRASGREVTAIIPRRAHDADRAESFAAQHDARWGIRSIDEASNDLVTAVLASDVCVWAASDGATDERGAQAIARQRARTPLHAEAMLLPIALHRPVVAELNEASQALLEDLAAISPPNDPGAIRALTEEADRLGMTRRIYQYLIDPGDGNAVASELHRLAARARDPRRFPAAFDDWLARR